MKRIMCVKLNHTTPTPQLPVKAVRTPNLCLTAVAARTDVIDEIASAFVTDKIL
jgi:hypothetical protein